nr:hypothetical protein [Tessaracoccus coleopterorum]
MWVGDDQVVGRIVEVSDDTVTLDVEGAARSFAVASIGKAVVQVEMNRSFEGEEEN